jgi:hypothetical protein
MQSGMLNAVMPQFATGEAMRAIYGRTNRRIETVEIEDVREIVQQTRLQPLC